METYQADPDGEAYYRRGCTKGNWDRSIYEVSASDDDTEAAWIPVARRERMAEACYE
jgi:hypothetical protein